MVEYTEYTKAPPLGRESGSKDALIPTIAQKGGGDCIDRCTTTPIWSMTERSKFRFRTLPFSIDGCSLAPLRGASGILTLHCTLQQAVVDGLGLHLCVHHHVEVGFSQKAAMRQHSKVQITHGTNSTFTYITYVHVSLSVATGILSNCGWILLVLIVLAIVSGCKMRQTWNYSRTSEQRTLWDHSLCPLFGGCPPFRGCLIFCLVSPLV